MGETTEISWTDHTFNPWIGCTRVSEGCRFCYAETMSSRYGWTKWGPGGVRRVEPMQVDVEPRRDQETVAGQVRLAASPRDVLDEAHARYGFVPVSP